MAGLDRLAGNRHEDAREGDAVTTATMMTEAPPTAADRCDRCGARAVVRAVLPGGGDLLFCGHHARAYEAKLQEVAVKIVRE